MRNYSVPTLIVVLGLMLSGCGNRQPGNSPGVIFTAAAQTLEVELTQSAPFAPTNFPATGLPSASSSPATTALPLRTDTPVQTAAVTAGPAQPCDAAKFIADVTIPDHTKLSAGESFIKTWRFANIGSCTWDPSYTLVFDAGDLIGGPANLPLPGSVAPGGQVDISVTLQAPSAAGSYRGYWRLRNPAGVMLPVSNGYNNKSFYVDIQVKNGGGGHKFAVTEVTFKVSHSGNCSSGIYTVTARLTTNGAGDVAYTWRRSDGVSEPLSIGTLIFSAAGTQIISYDWPSGATGLSMTLYIDNPNQQDFGTALLNCP